MHFGFPYGLSQEIYQKVLLIGGVSQRRFRVWYFLVGVVEAVVLRWVGFKVCEELACC